MECNQQRGAGHYERGKTSEGETRHKQLVSSTNLAMPPGNPAKYLSAVGLEHQKKKEKKKKKKTNEKNKNKNTNKNKKNPLKIIMLKAPNKLLKTYTTNIAEKGNYIQ